MINTQKLTSLGFEFHDGLKPSKNTPLNQIVR